MMCRFVVIRFCCSCCLFFFKQKTAYEMRISDWSSDVCSSDLRAARRIAISRSVERPSLHAASPVRCTGQDRPSVPGEPQMTMPTNLRRNASAIALGLALTAWLPAAAMAQDADTAPVEAAQAEGELIVTGLRGPHNKSATAKKRKPTNLKGISAPSTGKL